MQDRSAFLLGPILVVVGLVLLLGQLGLPGFHLHWPLLLVAVGIGFLLRWMQRRKDGSQVFTGTLLILLGCLFQWDQWFDLSFGRVWPFFPFAVGCAFVARGLSENRERSAISLGSLMIAFAAVAWIFGTGLFRDFVGGLARFISTVVQVAIPIGLIIWGSWLIFRRRKGLGRKYAAPEKLEPPASIRRSVDDDDNIRATD